MGIRRNRVLSEPHLKKDTNHIKIQKYPRELYLVKVELEEAAFNTKKPVLE